MLANSSGVQRQPFVHSRCRKHKGFVDDVLWGDDGKPLALAEASGTASASQLQCIDGAVQHPSEHGAMPAERLYASPFTDIHAQGPDGVFGAANVEHLFKALEGLELQQAVA